MKLLPEQEDVVRILRETGALRKGHFEYPNGSHSNEYLQVPLAMRHYQHAKVLTVGLSRMLRANTEIRTVIPELSIVCPATGGLPVAYGLCEALQAKKAYWAEREAPGQPYRFRPFIEPQPGEQILLVDDILHSGTNLAHLKATLESFGAIVLGLAVIVYQPIPRAHDFGALPLYYLARLEASYFADAEACDLCHAAEPLTKVWV
ncbi:MAG: orotate phosphoribosyltransferase [Bryobacterales bacterium]|jgi:orotate phosphoribosyltransferase|nr:orotate phosphoribosyltransferase [Bryobacterales bacterium]